MKHVRLCSRAAERCDARSLYDRTSTQRLSESSAERDESRPRPIPPKPDPRDLKIADLERQKADLEAELAKLRSSSAADLDQAKARINELENQLSQRDRELAGLRSAVGDKDRLASQLSDATGSCRPRTKNWRA